MMQLTEEQRKALIDWAKKYILVTNRTVELHPNDESAKANLALLKIALSSLTAEPVGYTVVTGAGNTLFRKHKPRKRVTNEAAIPVYTSPPAPALRIPECFHRLLNHAYGMSMGNDWNKGTMAGHHRQKLINAVAECREEVKRLNTTAPAEVKE